MNIPKVSSDISICKKIKDDDYEKIILEHRKKRGQALLKLNHLMKIDKSQNNYINLDLIKYFEDYFLLSKADSDCLCKLDDNILIKQKFAEGAVGIVYLISISGKDYVMKGIPNIDFNIPNFEIVNISDYHSDQQKHNKSIDYNIKKLSNGNKSILAIGSDSFVNQTFVHMIINEIFQNKINNYIHQYDAFYCKSDTKYIGFNIMNIANSGDLADFIRDPTNKFSYNMIIDMFKQLLFPLSILKCNKYGFVHADLKINNIFVHKKNNEIIYKLADFDKSSIYWNGIRFYNNKSDFVGSSLLNFYKGAIVNEYQKTNYYTFNSKIGYDIQYYTMNSPLPVFMSYDIYTFVISLFREPVVYQLVEKRWNDKNDTISQLLNILFYDEEVEIFKNNMKKNYERYTEYINTLNHIPLHDYIKLYQNRKVTDGININMKSILNNYLMMLNENNKGIGNINVELNNYKLKVDVDNIYKLFGIPDSMNDINCKLDVLHQNDQNIYQVANKSNFFVTYNNICITDCRENKCKIYTGETYDCS